jgi:hypothetical protein
MAKAKVRGEGTAEVIKELRRIPGIGPSLARDLIDLGITRVPSLRGRDPEKLYQRLCALRGVHQDRCVLYTFRCAVYFASASRHDPELLKWWNWQDAKIGVSAEPELRKRLAGGVTARPAPWRGDTRRRRAGSGRG